MNYLKHKRNKKFSAFKVNIERIIMRYFKINTVIKKQNVERFVL